jgi:acyl carrier protein
MGSGRALEPFPHWERRWRTLSNVGTLYASEVDSHAGHEPHPEDRPRRADWARCPLTLALSPRMDWVVRLGDWYEAQTTSVGVASSVRGIIRDQLHVSEDALLSGASFVDDLEADSLALVELALCFEEEFDIDIHDEDVEGIWTVQDAIDYVGQRIAVRPSRDRAT